MLNLEKIDSALGPIHELTDLFQGFLKESYSAMFDVAVKYLWLEKQIMYEGRRRTRRFRNGHIPDQLFARYMMAVVGHDQTTLTRSRWFTVVSASAAEMFPEFLSRNPFDDPEYYRWPYKHVSVDFLAYVYQVKNRFELLDYAEERHMSFHDFKNWVNNYVLSYNDDKGETIYTITIGRDGSPYIKHRDWENWPEASDLEKTLNNEYAKKTETNSDDVN